MPGQRWFNTVTAALAVALIAGSWEGMRIFGQYEEWRLQTTGTMSRMQYGQAIEYAELKARLRSLERLTAKLESEIQRTVRDKAYRQ